MHPLLTAALIWTALSLPAGLLIGRALRNADHTHICPCGGHQ